MTVAHGQVYRRPVASWFTCLIVGSRLRSGAPAQVCAPALMVCPASEEEPQEVIVAIAYCIVQRRS